MYTVVAHGMEQGTIKSANSPAYNATEYSICLLLWRQGFVAIMLLPVVVARLLPSPSLPQSLLLPVVAVAIVVVITTVVAIIVVTTVVAIATVVVVAIVVVTQWLLPQSSSLP